MKKIPVTYLPPTNTRSNRESQMEDFDFVKGIGPNATREVIQALIAQPATDKVLCCVCGEPATHRRGGAVRFPFCERHYDATR